MLERNSVNVHSNSYQSLLYKSEDRMAVHVVLEIFLNGLAKSQRVLPSSLILNDCNLYYEIFFLVCMIKTVPHSTVSPQM